MYRLYGRPGSGSVVVEAVLEAAEAPYEVEIIERSQDGRVPEKLARVNPLGQVPALTLPNGTVMTESAAISLYLADKYPKANLAPAPDAAERPAYLRWLVFLATNIYMTDLRAYYPDRYTSDQNGGKCVKAAALARMAQEWDVYAAALGDKPFILGDKMCVADVYAAMLATWNLDVPSFFKKHPNVRAMYDRVTANPAIARAWGRNEMEDWKN
ncbi:glutathione S-transferase family protein [Aestuariivirga sp. YIM B02566]|jgi:glutathione S-transferase|uniref:Glutathione S-transferase family protein n=1 Tax=Taklimakanibacter albus TaxID=2800327 RepID=A0ACC5QZ80_9HYPH|nr:glutathione S-transferase family protein [Aestuariivirga sp. YIM B02566]MBK1865493.1 glutathione S-transferase family protein [Aestuariivirga sp. YIM B02566]